MQITDINNCKQGSFLDSFAALWETILDTEQATKLHRCEVRNLWNIFINREKQIYNIVNEDSMEEDFINYIHKKYG